MFIIKYGTVAVYSEDGEEIMHLQDGEMFGEDNLLSNNNRVSFILFTRPL